jgi:hypothetical protein
VSKTQLIFVSHARTVMPRVVSEAKKRCLGPLIGLKIAMGMSKSGGSERSRAARAWRCQDPWKNLRSTSDQRVPAGIAHDQKPLEQSSRVPSRGRPRLVVSSGTR